MSVPGFSAEVTLFSYNRMNVPSVPVVRPVTGQTAVVPAAGIKQLCAGFARCCMAGNDKCCDYYVDSCGY